MSKDTLKEALRELQELHREGFLLEQEYHEQKQALLASYQQKKTSEIENASSSTPVLKVPSPVDWFATGGKSPFSEQRLAFQKEEAFPFSPSFSMDGRYRLESLLGSGGMGEVWKAWDSFRSETVALKKIKTGQELDEHAKARFVREVESLKAIHHPHIVKILDYHLAQSYFVMEYLEGENVREYLLSDSAKTLWNAVIVLKHVLEALQELHSKGLIHRDIKPENIFLCEKDPQQVKLLDFGLVRVDSSKETTERGALGTAYYMAPEQLDASRKGEISPATDLYACGILFYELVTGKTMQVGSMSLQHFFAKNPSLRVESFVELYPVMDLFLQTLVAHDPLKRGTIGEHIAFLDEIEKLLPAHKASSFRSEVVLKAENKRLPTLPDKKIDALWYKQRHPSNFFLSLFRGPSVLGDGFQIPKHPDYLIEEGWILLQNSFFTPHFFLKLIDPKSTRVLHNRFRSVLEKLEKWALVYPSYQSQFVQLWNTSCQVLQRDPIDTTYFEAQAIDWEFLEEHNPNHLSFSWRGLFQSFDSTEHFKEYFRQHYVIIFKRGLLLLFLLVLLSLL